MINRDEIRAFIAIELPGELKSMLKDFENKLKTPKSSCAKWVDPASIHLTLKFLGNTGPKLLDELKRDVEAEVRKSQPLMLATAETGCFPNTLRPRVYWLGLSGDIDRLLDLQSRIDECASRLGFPRESRPFTAHLTLARLRDDCSVAQRSGFAELVKGARLEPGFSMRVSAVSLIRSQLRPEGAIYTRLSRFEMADG
jgi:2'-5' RNA ligase